MKHSSEMPAAENVAMKGNPTEEDSHALSKNVKSGILTGCMADVTELDGSVMESMVPLHLVNNTEEISINGDNGTYDVASRHADMMIPSPDGGHVGKKEHVQALKTKHTWTRVSRMDVGPGKELQKTNPITLGKRGMDEDRFEQDIETKGKEGKRGKYQEENLKNEAAGVQEHPCRTQ